MAANLVRKPELATLATDAAVPLPYGATDGSRAGTTEPAGADEVATTAATVSMDAKEEAAATEVAVAGMAVCRGKYQLCRSWKFLRGGRGNIRRRQSRERR